MRTIDIPYLIVYQGNVILLFYGIVIACSLLKFVFKENAMYKPITNDTVSKILTENISLSNIEEAARKYNISEDTIKRRFEVIQILVPYLAWLSPKKNTLCRRIFAYIKLTLFMPILWLCVCFKKWKGYTC